MEPMGTHGNPAVSRPMHTSTFNDYDYLITVDYLSKYFELDRLPPKAARDVIYCLKKHFAKYGIGSQGKTKSSV